MFTVVSLFLCRILQHYCNYLKHIFFNDALNTLYSTVILVPIISNSPIGLPTGIDLYPIEHQAITESPSHVPRNDEMNTIVWLKPGPPVESVYLQWRPENIQLKSMSTNQTIANRIVPKIWKILRIVLKCVRTVSYELQII